MKWEWLRKFILIFREAFIKKSVTPVNLKKLNVKKTNIKSTNMKKDKHKKRQTWKRQFSNNSLSTPSLVVPLLELLPGRVECVDIAYGNFQHYCKLLQVWIRVFKTDKVIF